MKEYEEGEGEGKGDIIPAPPNNFPGPILDFGVGSDDIVQ